MAESQVRQIVLGKHKLNFQYGYSALLALMDTWELEQDEVAERVGKTNIRDLPIILWAGTRVKHPDLTPADIKDMLDDADFADLGKSLNAAFSAAQPRAKPVPPVKGQRQIPTRRR